MIRPRSMMFLCSLLAAQIEEAIFEPHVLGIFLVAEDRQRQFRGRAQNLDLRHIDFDLSRSAFPSSRSPPARLHRCRQRHAPIPSARFGREKAGESGSTTHCVIP